MSVINIIKTMMKKELLLALLFIPVFSFAQNKSHNQSKDSLLVEIRDAVQVVQSINATQGLFGLYKMYPTENIHILIKLNTATGVIKLVQWNLDSDEEFEVYVNSEDLSSGLLSKKGRYELYPTKNMYQFILLDTMLGFTYHVQWGTEESNCWIRQISSF